MNIPQKCIICLNEGCNLISISERDESDLQLSYKLNFCVPEVDWIESHQICSNCVVHLDTAYAFRYLCLGSLGKAETVLCYCSRQLLNAEVKQEESKPVVKDEFLCLHCGLQFTRKLLLIAHIRTKHKVTPCGYCNEVHTDNKCTEIVCDKCSQAFTTENSLIIHAKSCTTSQSNCTEGELKTNTIKAPKRGRKRLDPLSNTCNICGMIFNTRYLAKRHMRNVHATEKNYQCEICQQRFASPVYLNAHKRYHSGERPHICSFCGKGFITGSDLYHHEKIHLNKRAYKCDKCPKAFNTSSDLHKHKLCVHQDRSEWKYVCTICNRRFPLKTNLDAHTKTHTGERNFACHLCNHKCVNRSVLQRHIKSHSNIRLFKCTVCVMEYKYQKSLDVHMAKAHGIGDAKIPERVKKYFCHICPKSYFANNKLQKHIRTHTGERPFSCQICDKRFIDKSYIKQHLKTAHNVSYNDLAA
ncbi:hypothetical protein PPYR_03647 [Photinus pyralis]|uniref:C2H2-type domain-containing protein n=1 Tax=Photinus pyralis TaxID=7054 RepID=A0A5N4A3F5_PHOPY|nr:zinc finger protein 585B-like [Photinus pyralis]KAB0791847.1 hypothetical protein PPYR_03647 [Photinus pyralis]